jgi:hypothetical protein
MHYPVAGASISNAMKVFIVLLILFLKNIFKNQLMIKLYFFFALIILCFSACKKEPDQVLPDFPWDCDYDIGTYEILPSSYAKIPYEGKQGVVFQDSLGNQVHFTQTDILSLHQESYILKHDPNDESIDIYYCYYKDSKFYQLYNDSLDFSISVKLYANPYYSAPLKGFIADQLTASIIKVNGPDFFFSSFSTTIDQRTFPEINQNLVEPVYDCFGRQFLQVEHQQFILSQPAIYFNMTEGVVSFKDDIGKKWCFERFE